MQVYRNFETDEVTSSPQLNKVFTIENYRTDFEYLSGREKRRQRRKKMITFIVLAIGIILVLIGGEK